MDPPWAPAARPGARTSQVREFAHPVTSSRRGHCAATHALLRWLGHASWVTPAAAKPACLSTRPGSTTHVRVSNCALQAAQPRTQPAGGPRAAPTTVGSPAASTGLASTAGSRPSMAALLAAVPARAAAAAWGIIPAWAAGSAATAWRSSSISSSSSSSTRAEISGAAAEAAAEATWIRSAFWPAVPLHIMCCPAAVAWCQYVSLRSRRTTGRP